MPDSLNKYIPDNPEYHVSIVDTAISNASNLPRSMDILSKIVSERIVYLYQDLIEANRVIHERTTLARNIQSQIDDNIINTVNLQNELISDPNLRTSLENQINNLHKEKRQQELSHWRDTVELERDLRKAEKELRTALLDLWMVRFLS